MPWPGSGALKRMKKLEKRQIIILAVAALFALYAAYELLIAGPAAKKAKIQDAAVQTETVAQAADAGDMTTYQVSAAEAYIVKKAEADWGKSPFWEKAAYREFVGREAAASVASAVKIIYSGYMEAGRKKIAIINGVEYERGEALEIEGYVLKNVTQSNVVVLNRDTGDELSIPIQE